MRLYQPLWWSLKYAKSLGAAVNNCAPKRLIKAHSKKGARLAPGSAFRGDGWTPGAYAAIVFWLAPLPFLLASDPAHIARVAAAR